MSAIERGPWLHKGHKVTFKLLEDDTVLVEEQFGESKGVPQRLDLYEAIEYQKQIIKLMVFKKNLMKVHKHWNY